MACGVLGSFAMDSSLVHDTTGHSVAATPHGHIFCTLQTLILNKEPEKSSKKLLCIFVILTES